MKCPNCGLEHAQTYCPLCGKASDEASIAPLVGVLIFVFITIPLGLLSGCSLWVVVSNLMQPPTVKNDYAAIPLFFLTFTGPAFLATLAFAVWLWRKRK